jgi:hypothetical protein
MSWTEDGSLFPKTHHSAIEVLTSDSSYINQYCFYGRCVGFQVNKPIFKMKYFINDVGSITYQIFKFNNKG